MAFRCWDPTTVDDNLRLILLDIVLNCCLITPLVVLYWHGTSAILDALLLNNFPVLGAWLILLLGICIEMCANACQKILPERLPSGGDVHSLALKVVVARVFNYAIAFGNVCHMKGVMELYGYYVGEDWYSAVRALTTGLLTLWGLRCGRNILGPPLYVGLDTFSFYLTPTLFRTEPDFSLENLLDNVATVVVVHTCVHLHWEGVWSLLDVVCPTSGLLAIITSLPVSLVWIAAFLYLQHLALKISRDFENKKEEMKRVLFENTFIFVANIGCIIMWRGLWISFDFLSEHFPIYYGSYDVTALVSNILSFVTLCLAMALNTLPCKGVEIDGELKQGEGVLFATGYLKEFFSGKTLETPRTAEAKSSQPQSKHNTNEVNSIQPHFGIIPKGSPKIFRKAKRARRSSTSSVHRVGVSRSDVIDPHAAMSQDNVGEEKQVTFGQNVLDNIRMHPQHDDEDGSLRSALINGAPKKVKRT